MSIYEWIIIVAFAIAGILYFVPNQKNKNKFFIYIFTGILLFILGFRSLTVGGDLLGYNVHYSNARYGSLLNFSNSEYFEIGYLLIEYIFANIGFSFQFFIFSISAFNLISMGYMVNKYAPSALLAYIFYIVLGIFDFNFSGLRQSIAMSIVSLSLPFLINKNWGKYLGTIFIASLFHSTSIIFIFLYPLLNIEKVRNLYDKLYVIIFLMVLLFSDTISFFLFSRYRDGVYLTSLQNDSYFLGIGNDELILLIIFLVGTYLRRVTKLSENQLFNNLLSLTSISVILQFLSPIHYFFVRLNLYLYGFVIIFVPFIEIELLNYITKRNKYVKFIFRVLYFPLLLIIALSFYSRYLESNPHQILPYRFFWE